MIPASQGPATPPEMFAGTERGALTRAIGTSARSLDGRPFYRRADLLDPSGPLHLAPLPR